MARTNPWWPLLLSIGMVVYCTLVRGVSSLSHGTYPYSSEYHSSGLSSDASFCQHQFPSFLNRTHRSS